MKLNKKKEIDLNRTIDMERKKRSVVGLRKFENQQRFFFVYELTIVRRCHFIASRKAKNLLHT